MDLNLNRDLVVCTSEYLPIPSERDMNTVYFVYDKMAVFVGRTFYSDPFCVLETVPEQPAEGMLYITTDGRLKLYVDYSLMDIGGTDNQTYIDRIAQAGTVYFMKAEYRYLDLQTRCIALPYQNGTYQLSVNLMKCLAIDKDTVIRYNEETGHFEIDGNYVDTQFHDPNQYYGVDTETVHTWTEGRQVYADVKVSNAANNAIRILGNGIFADVGDCITTEEFEQLVQLFRIYKDSIDTLIAELEEAMAEEGYDTTLDMIAELILEALEDYKPTIEDMFANYDMIFEQLGYIRGASIDYTDEKVEELRQEIIDYITNLSKAWDLYENDPGTTIDDETLTEEEAQYLANAVEKARADIILNRTYGLPEDGSCLVDLDYAYIYDGIPESGQQILGEKLKAESIYGREPMTTCFAIYEPIPDGYFFYYKFTDVIVPYGADAPAEGFTRWNPYNDILSFYTDTPIQLVMTNANKKVVKYFVEPHAKVRITASGELVPLNINMVRQIGTTLMDVYVYPEKQKATNKYSYGVLDSVIPQYDGLLPVGFTEWDGISPINLGNYDGVTITIIEHDSNNLCKALGMYQVDLKADILHMLTITCDYGSENGFTKIVSIYPQRQEDGNKYYYTYGYRIPDYNEDIAGNPIWEEWIEPDQIQCHTYDETISVVECKPENGKIKVQRAGYFTAKCNNTYTPTYYYDQSEYMQNIFVDNSALKLAYKNLEYYEDIWLNYKDDLPGDFTLVERSLIDDNFHIPIVPAKRIAVCTMIDNTKVKQFTKVEPDVVYARNISFDVANVDTNKISLVNISTIAENIVRYFYQLMAGEDGKIYYYNEPINIQDYEEWSVGLVITLVDRNIDMIRLVGVDQYNRIVAVGKQPIIR